MKHNESLENYLESILMIGEQKPVVRSVDIANELGYKKSSISVAVKNMKEQNYIEGSEEGYITLTKTGKKLAKSVYERHQFFRDWLIGLGVDPETANDDACSMEHVISEETFKAIKSFIEKK